MAATAGQIAKSSIAPEVVSVPIAASTKITIGDPVSWDTSGNTVVATASVGSRAVGYGIALETQDNTSGNAGDLNVRVAIGHTCVYMVAGGTIQQNSLVKVTSSSKVIAHTKPADVTTTPVSGDVNTARDYFGLAFGRYIGHENEELVPTAAASNDVIIVRLGP